jgi:choline dehydrogenase-like flavoprotein
VGRNLQGHHYTGATGYFPFEVYDDIGPGTSIAICDYNHGTPGLHGGGMLANEFTRLPYQMVDRLPEGTPRWGLAHKQAMRQWHKRSMVVMGPTQQIPSASARVTLDPRVRDRYGMPVARIDGNVHPHTFEIGDRQSERAAAWLKEAGAIHVSPMSWHPDTVSAGQHQAGTCRMGADPRGSVVNRNCQLHDVDNVFLIDGSVHVTNGGFNPVLTIMAVAYYASDALVRNWKGTRFRS